ncbi:MAG: flagellin [bacterium]
MSVTRVATNPEALSALRYVNKVQDDLSKTLNHLSSGLRITKGADDPSGIGLAARFEAQMRGTSTAIQNVQDAQAIIALADETINNIMELLLRARDLAVRSANDATMTTSSRIPLENELDDIRDAIDQLALGVTFNTKGVLDGDMAAAVVQAGPDNNANMRVTIVINAISAGNIGGRSITGAKVSTGSTSLATVRSAINLIQSAINGLSNVQAAVGVQSSRLEKIINSLSSAEVNMASAVSRIRDADMAKEISNLARQQVIMQAGVAAVAQANMQPSAILTLLGTAA